MNQKQLDRKGWEWPGNKGSDDAELHDNPSREETAEDIYPQLPGTVLRIPWRKV